MENFKRLFPTEFYAKFIENNIRPDGRTLRKTRKISVAAGSIATADGSALVRIGHTSVVAGAKAEVGAPSLLPSSQIVVNVELTPLCAGRFKTGPPSEQAQTLSRELNRIVQRYPLKKDHVAYLPSTDLVQTDNLMVAANKAVWYIYVDIYCLDHDGNIFDACLLALVACLQDGTKTSLVRLPQAKLSADGAAVDVVNPDNRPLALTLRHIPVSTSFGIILQEHVILDTTAEEEELTSGTVNVVVNNKNEICALLKPGGTPLSEEQIKSCVALATERVPELLELLSKAHSK